MGPYEYSMVTTDFSGNVECLLFFLGGRLVQFMAVSEINVHT